MFLKIYFHFLLGGTSSFCLLLSKIKRTMNWKKKWTAGDRRCRMSFYTDGMKVAFKNIVAQITVQESEQSMETWQTQLTLWETFGVEMPFGPAHSAGSHMEMLLWPRLPSWSYQTDVRSDPGAFSEDQWQHKLSPPVDAVRILHLSAGSRNSSTGDSGLWQATAQMSHLNMIKLSFSKRLWPGVAPKLPQTPSCWPEFYQKTGNSQASLALDIWLRNMEKWLGLQCSRADRIFQNMDSVE